MAAPPPRKFVEMEGREASDLIADLVVDDYYGLWELVGWIRRDSTESIESVLHRGQAAIRDLLKQGIVDLYRGSSFTGEERLVPDAEFDAALADAWWKPHGDEEHTRVYASVTWRSALGLTAHPPR
jgi:hypothetical protein